MNAVCARNMENKNQIHPIKSGEVVFCSKYFDILGGVNHLIILIKSQNTSIYRLKIPKFSIFPKKL